MQRFAMRLKKAWICKQILKTGFGQVWQNYQNQAVIVVICEMTRQLEYKHWPYYLLAL